MSNQTLDKFEEALEKALQKEGYYPCNGVGVTIDEAMGDRLKNFFDEHPNEEYFPGICAWKKEKLQWMV